MEMGTQQGGSLLHLTHWGVSRLTFISPGRWGSLLQPKGIASRGERLPRCTPTTQGVLTAPAIGGGGCPCYSFIAGSILIAPPVPGGAASCTQGLSGACPHCTPTSQVRGDSQYSPSRGVGRGSLPHPRWATGALPRPGSLLHPPNPGRGSLAHPVCVPPAPCRACHVVPVHAPPPKTDLCGVCRLLGGQHGVGAVLARKVADDADGAAILHAVEPQRFAVTGATRRPRRAGRSGGGQRRGGGGRPRRGFSGARRQPQLANDVDDITERTIRTEKPLRHRLPALRAAETPRRVLPALGHAGAAEVMTALGHQHRVVKVLQAHRTRQFVLQATGSAAGSRWYGGGSGRRLHPGSPA